MSPGAAPLPNARPDAAERFARDLTALVAAPTSDHPLALAVSGGPDSMAMLALAAAAFPGRVIAATVDHRLRAAAAQEAAMVAGWCAAQGIAHATLAPDHPPAGASLQAQARHVRYALLGDWALAHGAGALATAHHADDQAETFLMRAARGSGPAGLAGIRPRWEYITKRWSERDARACAPRPDEPASSPDTPSPQPSSRRRPGSPSAEDGPAPRGDPGLRRGDVQVSDDIRSGNDPEMPVDPPSPDRDTVRNPEDTPALPIVRPLLTWRRADLRAIAAALPFVDDPANVDPRHDRTAARALLATGAFDPVALAAAAAHCREVDVVLADTADRLWRTRAVADIARCMLDTADLPRELCRRLARRAIGHVRAAQRTEGHWSDATNIEPLLDALLLGTAATQAGVLATPRGTLWHFRPAPPRRSY